MAIDKVSSDRAASAPSRDVERDRRIREDRDSRAREAARNAREAARNESEQAERNAAEEKGGRVDATA